MHRSLFKSKSHFHSFTLQKQVIRSKKIVVFTMFHCFSHFYAHERIAPVALHSHPTLQKSDGSDLLLQKSSGSDLLLEKSESLFRSYAHKKPVILTKNQRENSQPCLCMYTTLYEIIHFFIIFWFPQPIFRYVFLLINCLMALLI